MSSATQATAEVVKEHFLWSKAVFEYKYRELWPHFSESKDATIDRIVAYIRLHKTSEENDRRVLSDQAFFLTLLEQAFLEMLDTGRLQNSVPLTKVAQTALNTMRTRVGVDARLANAVPRGAARTSQVHQQTPVQPQPAPSRWAHFTQGDYDQMSAAKVRELRKSDPEFVQAVARLASDDAAQGLSPDCTGRVFLRRRTDLQFFAGWKNGEALWTPDSQSWAHMTYPEAHRIISKLKEWGVFADAYEIGGSNPLTDVSPRAVATREVPKPETWQIEASGVEGTRSPVSTNRFILKTSNGYVAFIDDDLKVIRTVRQPSYARSFSGRELPRQIAESIANVPFVLCRGDGQQVSWTSL
jgi:hypothetical protein